MSNLMIIAILLLGSFSGARRGLIVQLVHTAGLIVSFILASFNFKAVANVLETLIPYPTGTTASDLNLYNVMKAVQFDQTFYNAVAFVLILLIGWIATRVVAAMLNNLTKIPILKQLNGIGGGVLGFLCNWIGLFFILSLLSTLPIAPIQNMFSGNSLATFIVKQTPVLSQYILDQWLVMR
ncbi:CvpA family protein [Carnobacteriaceae bacterium zg-ZUI252]|nr:CvpA family protein [Carnobacteriaceae bacterium zg-ZUI252]MBS4770495.1 CvpA family protein [Carnobacteriaceae bacterium zg-ZUI240]QTU82812.1 CvpA family protein [Carnobacteriaceae bacterium zg-C25]